jgi:hypothetical protein
MGIELDAFDTSGLVHLFEGYGYLALGALLLLAAAGAPLQRPISPIGLTCSLEDSRATRSPVVASVLLASA